MQKYVNNGPNMLCIKYTQIWYVQHDFLVRKGLLVEGVNQQGTSVFSNK